MEYSKDTPDLISSLDNGFIQPVLNPVEENGKIIDVKLEIPMSFYNQMIEYGKKYANLPVIN